MIELGPGVRCVSPGLVAVQLASKLPKLELLMLLSELLGLYAISPDREADMNPRTKPILSTQDLQELLGKMSGARGVGAVRRALKIAPINAASPMEAKLYLRTTIPCSQGGYGLGNVILNDPVGIGRLSESIKELRIRKPDLLFLGVDGSKKRGVCLDYMGAHHQSQVICDTVRRNELIANGFSPYEIYKEHYDNIDYMDALMSQIRSELGLPSHETTRWRSDLERERRMALWHELEEIDMQAWVRDARLR
ncbi:hypothetical protein [Paratractidigestivibacter sp.]|uniref:hypothetical protein n=1 Tax=Paratractidigestivibacter sp. TaxID=2847316 RepID=UPI002ABE7CDD|nr:hypothetical protein [Paratractidigestivibacter sp.]